MDTPVKCLHPNYVSLRLATPEALVSVSSNHHTSQIGRLKRVLVQLLSDLVLVLIHLDVGEHGLGEQDAGNQGPGLAH